jgi:hypothetical protein
VVVSLFSERLGYRKPKDVVQKDSMDDDLRIGIWNCFADRILSHHSSGVTGGTSEFSDVIRSLWHGYFKRPLDSIPQDWSDCYQYLRRYLLHDCPWDSVYDFIEFFLAHYSDPGRRKARFTACCNAVLERELSAYRLIDERFVPITDEEELAAVEEALNVGGPLKPIRAHLVDALEKLSDRQAPDYRNSIKESISAVEALCQLIAGDDKATLGQALDAVGGKLPIHGALLGALEKLYGYTSDAEGIRHALLDEPTLEFEDAKFMLVSCAGFINYMVAKAGRVGVSFK